MNKFTDQHWRLILVDDLDYGGRLCPRLSVDLHGQSFVRLDDNRGTLRQPSGLSHARLRQKFLFSSSASLTLICPIWIADSSPTTSINLSPMSWTLCWSWLLAIWGNKYGMCHEVELFRLLLLPHKLLPPYLNKTPSLWYSFSSRTQTCWQCWVKQYPPNWVHCPSQLFRHRT